PSGAADDSGGAIRCFRRRQQPTGVTMFPRTRRILGLIAASILVASGTAEAKTEPPFTFVVFGDNRPASADKPQPDVFKQILGEVRVLHPDFVVTTGDLIYGSVKDQVLVQKEYD